MFDAILEAFWFPFWMQNRAFWEVILNICLDSAESGASHENSINSNENETRALGKATKQPPTTEEKTVRKRRRNSDTFLMHF